MAVLRDAPYTDLLSTLLSTKNWYSESPEMWQIKREDGDGISAVLRNRNTAVPEQVGVNSRRNCG